MSQLKINESQFEVSVWAFQPTTKFFPSKKEYFSNRIKEMFQTSAKYMFQQHLKLQWQEVIIYPEKYALKTVLEGQNVNIVTNNIFHDYMRSKTMHAI